MDQLAYLFFFLQSTSFQLAPPLPDSLTIFSKVSIEAETIAEIPAAEAFLSSPAAFEDSIQSLYDNIRLSEYDLSFQVFKYAMTGYYSLRQAGKLSDKRLLTIIDFTKSSSKKRFYTIDLSTLAVKFYTYVSHGKNTGEDIATSFSNILHSNQSSIGFYVTGETYVGSKGYSLKLDGVERGYNDKMRERAVVMHNAEYVSESWIKKYGRLGRSQGCPALPVEIGKKVIEVVKNRTMIFAYYNDDTYLQSSPYLNLSNLFPELTASAR